MKDKSMDKIKKHYFLCINDKKYKVLSHELDIDKSLFVIKTKISGQDFPYGDNMSLAVSDEKGDIKNITVDFRGSFKNEKIESWEYTVLN